jgi:hypothetical protein
VYVSLFLTEAVKVFLGPDVPADEHAHVLAVEIVIKVVDDVHFLWRDGGEVGNRLDRRRVREERGLCICM